MEVGNCLTRVSEVGNWFPRVFRGGITEPFDEVLKGASVASRIQNGFDFIFGNVVDNIRRWWGWRRMKVRIMKVGTNFGDMKGVGM